MQIIFRESVLLRNHDSQCPQSPTYICKVPQHVSQSHVLFRSRSPSARLNNLKHMCAGLMTQVHHDHSRPHKNRNELQTISQCALAAKGGRGLTPVEDGLIKGICGWSVW